MKTPHWARHSASAAHQRNLGVYVVDNLRLQHTLEEAKAEMDAAAKTARERASGKAGQTAKKTELHGGQQTDSTGPEAPADWENPPLLPACGQFAPNGNDSRLDRAMCGHGYPRCSGSTIAN